MQFLTLLLLALVAAAVAFNSKAASRPAKISMLFGAGGKKTTSKAAAPAKPAAKPAAKVSSQAAAGYVPEGLTQAQYQKFLADEEAKKAKKAAKFPKGKQPETLTEWFDKATSQFGTGKDVRVGHRIVKLKYEEGYGPDPSQ